MWFFSKNEPPPKITPPSEREWFGFVCVDKDGDTLKPMYRAVDNEYWANVQRRLADENCPKLSPHRVVRVRITEAR